MTERKRDWSRIKGYRNPLPRVPVIYRGVYDDSNGNLVAECLVVHGRRKFCFWCTAPPEKEMSWRDVHGMLVDDRVWPDLPRGFERLRPLRTPGKLTSHQAKSTAFAVLKELRANELFRREQPSLFPED